MASLLTEDPAAARRAAKTCARRWHVFVALELAAARRRGPTSAPMHLLTSRARWTQARTLCLAYRTTCAPRELLTVDVLPRQIRQCDAPPGSAYLDADCDVIVRWPTPDACGNDTSAFTDRPTWAHPTYKISVTLLAEDLTEEQCDLVAAHSDRRRAVERIRRGS